MAQNAIAAVQYEPVIGEVETNVRRIADLADDLPESVGVAVVPELGVTGYDLDVARSTTDPIPGPLTDGVADIARDQDLHVLAGLPERSGERLYNALVHVSPEGVESVYRKQRLWGAETDVFDQGVRRTVIETPAGRVGLLVCYDINFPELCLRYAEKEVDVLAVSSAWRSSFLEDWRLLLRARALDGTCYAVGSNHIGDQQGRQHAGHSLIAGPTGAIEAEADTEPGSVVVDIDEGHLADARKRNPVHQAR